MQFNANDFDEGIFKHSNDDEMDLFHQEIKEKMKSFKLHQSRALTDKQLRLTAAIT